jgi:sarcosine oxidase/L-pipecolate oxidase
MSPSNTSKQPSVLIVGAGAIGLSTALHLSNRNYKNIVVLDRGTTIPSAYSAGNDLNKIVRADYEDAFYASHALVSLPAFLSL